MRGNLELPFLFFDGRFQKATIKTQFYRAVSVSPGIYIIAQKSVQQRSIRVGLGTLGVESDDLVEVFDGSL